MYHLRESNPSIWEELANGNFTVNTNAIPFTSIGIDEAQEHINKVHKGDGAITGITTNPNSLLKYCLSTPELTRLDGEVEKKLNISHSGRQKHHHDSPARTSRQEKAILKLHKVLQHSKLFTVNELDDDLKNKLFNITTKMIMPEGVQHDILDTETRGRRSFNQFVEERIIGEKNMWEKMPKVKFQSWNSGSKTVKLKAPSEEVSLKATNSLFVCLLIIAKSSRDIDMENVIGTHEFCAINSTLMKADGSLHPCTDKSKLIHALEELANENSVSETTTHLPNDSVSIIFDGMAVVNEMTVHRSSIHNCKELAEYFVHAVEKKSLGYSEAYVVFDDYSKQHSLKDRTRQLHTAGRATSRGHMVEDKTQIRDFKVFLNSKETKDQLTLYLAEKLVQTCKIHVTTHTRKGVSSSHENSIRIPSTQEEADTLLILYAVEVSKSGKTVHIYSPDTDVLVLALRRVPLLGSHALLIMGTGERQRHMKLKVIYDSLGPVKASALPGFHSLTGSDTTGHIQGKGKLTCFKAFLKSSDDTVYALAQLGIGATPSPGALSGCEQFLCQIFNPNFSSAKALRWHTFKQLKVNQGVEKLPPTQGVIIQHILRAHLQANVWHQDLNANPELLDPTTLGWVLNEDRTYQPVVSTVAPAPEAVVELVKCSCVASRCSGRCSCKSHSLPCTELCKCGASEEMCDNQNTGEINDENSDTDEWSDEEQA